MKALLTIALVYVLVFNSTIGQNLKVIQKDLVSDQTYFIENKGQWDNTIKYSAFLNGMNVVIKNDGLYFDVFQISSNADNKIFKSGSVIKTAFKDCEKYTVKQQNFMAGIYNYLKTSDQKNWITGARLSKELLLNNVYKGIDIKMMIEESNPRYDFIIYPGSNPQSICMTFEGAEVIKVQNNELIASTNQGDLKHSQVKAFQNINGIYKEIKCNFIQKKDGVGFSLSDYDKNYPLTIDPTVFSDYIGGSGDDAVTSVKIMPNGYVVAAGWTGSSNFMTTPGVYDSLLSGDVDAFVREYKVTGSIRELIFSTIFGGSDVDKALGVDFDDNGDIYITGSTVSADFPAMNSINTHFSGVVDAYITKLSNNGKSIIYSSYFGGSKEDVGTGITVDLDHSVAICGYTNSMNYNTYGSADQTKLKGLYDGFITKINAKGSSYIVSTYWGGTSNDKANAIITDSEGFLYVVGETSSADFPIVPYRVSNGGWGQPPAGTVYEQPFSLRIAGGTDAWAMKLSSAGSGTEYSTYFGGKGDDRATGVTFAEDGTLVFCGETSTETGTAVFPTSSSAYSKTNKGGIDGFVARLDKIKVTSVGSGGGSYNKKTQDLLFSTMFGSSGNDYVSGMSQYISNDGFYIVGKTGSANFPIVGDDVTKKIAGKNDAYIVKINTQGTDVLWSTLFGGAGEDDGLAVSTTPDGQVYVGGATSSADIIKPNINFQPKFGGGATDGYIAKITLQTLNITFPIVSEQFCAGSTINITWNTTGFPLEEKFEMVYRLKQTDDWTLITKDAMDGSFKWTIPALPNPEDSVQLRLQHSSGLWQNSSFFRVMSSPKANIVSIFPENNMVCEGDELNIITNVAGNNLGFKWYLNNVIIQDQTSKDLVIKNVKLSNTGKYKLVIAGTCKPDITTPETQFTVNPATKITLQPIDSKVKKGENVQFSVNASGLDLTYEWQRNGSRILAATESTYKLENVQKDSEGKYRCIVNGKCYSDTSYAAQLDVDTTTSVIDNSGSDLQAIQIINENADEIIISVNSVNSISEIILTNINGLVSDYPELLSGNASSYNYKIKKAQLSSGVYFIKVNSSSNSYVKKINIIK